MDPTFAFATTLPFGMNMRQHNAWMICGGGLELVNDILRDYNTVYVPGLHTGAQMGGWFRKEIKSLDDIKGLGCHTELGDFRRNGDRDRRRV
jgi:TRAP-type mannitol/chloroaromatic compound transport system substrate-binding protein